MLLVAKTFFFRFRVGITSKQHKNLEILTSHSMNSIPSLPPFACKTTRRPHFDQMTLVQAAAAIVEPAKQIPITDDDGEGNDDYEELPSCNCAAFLIKIG